MKALIESTTSLVVGLAVAILLMVSQSIRVNADDCSKNCGYGGEVADGSREGCRSGGGGCIWVMCSVDGCGGGNGPYNDKCHEHIDCIPLD
jgi:hypothetical protein